jgi:dihydroorotate dehydrogenase (fumarate)
LLTKGLIRWSSFNRYYRADIDIDSIKVVNGPIISNPDEMLISLQWIALLRGKIKAEISATTGIHNYKDAVKLLLAGADTLQLCSALYKKGNGPDSRKYWQGSEQWMKKHNFSSIDEFRGIMSEENSKNSYKRVQFIKSIVGIE